MSTPDLSCARWRKSSRTEGNNNCVELAHAPGVAAVRDSKNPGGPVLTFNEAGLLRLVAEIKTGRLTR